MSKQLGGIFWLAISVFVCTESIKSDIGDLHAPGPGFFPFWSAVVLGLLSIVLIIYSTVKKHLRIELAAIWRGCQWGKVVAMLCSFLIYLLLLPKLGFLITTFVLMFIAAAVIDRSRLRHGISAIIIVVASYIIFEVVLDVKLPKGVFGF